MHLPQQVKNLRLDRHVERGRRFVSDHQRGAAGERDGNHHPLAHAAGQLVRVVADTGRRIRDVHRLHQFHGTGARLAPARAPMDDERLGNLVADREHRVQRRHRLLENQRDFSAADGADGRLVEPEEIAAFEADGTRGNPSRRLHQTEDGKRGDRFAAARLADQAQRLACPDLEADIVHGRDRSARRFEYRRQMLDRQQRVCTHASSETRRRVT